MESQAGILRRLLEELETEEAEDQEVPSGIAAQFARLRSLSTQYRADKTFPTKSAEKSDNIKKNRYKDIIPFDHSRVKLTFTTSKNDTDYINANFIKGVTGSRAYIATQGPLPHTVLDFLRMLWEYDIKVVVMACREFEMGKKKCECYWPKEKSEPYVCEPFTIYCDSEENKGDYVTRTLRVNYHNFSRTLIQLHYVNWPDHGVPNTIPPILDMLHEMRSYQDHDDTPICIHCSAGCGRTGVLCVIDYTWNLLKKQMITSDFNIYNLVQNMRTQRPSVVQTKEQYVLVYRTIKLLFETFLHSEESLKQGSEVETDEAVLVELETEHYDVKEDLNDLDKQLQHLLKTRNHLSSSEHSHRQETETNHLWQFHDNLQVTSFFTEIPKRASPQDLRIQTPPKQREVGRIVEQSREEESENIVPCPSSSVATVCLMVEDPYFDSPTEEVASNPHSTAETPSLSINDQPVEVFSFTDSGTLAVHSDDEIPPPLPKRTPESFEVPDNIEPCTRLALVIPRNAAADAVKELRGSPPSPVPPLPERTPESFELAIDPAPAEEREQPTHPVNLSLLGLSSEWSGSSGLAVDHNETKSWMRSKSLRAKTTEFSQSRQTSNKISKPSRSRRTLDLPPPPPPPGHAVNPPPAAVSPFTHDNTHGLNSTGPAPTHPEALTHPGPALTHPGPALTHPGPALTHPGPALSHPGSALTHHGPALTHPGPALTHPGPALTHPGPPLSHPEPALTHPGPALTHPGPALTHPGPALTHPGPPLTLTGPALTHTGPLTHTAPPTHRARVSSEWDGATGSKNFLDIVMNRSKSVRVKSTFRESRSQTPPPAAEEAHGTNTHTNADPGHSVNHTLSVGTEVPEKGMTRSKSLRFFRSKPKTKVEPPRSQPSTPPPSYESLTSFFKFGFGTRFGKPKGPRSYPETWV